LAIDLLPHHCTQLHGNYVVSFALVLYCLDIELKKIMQCVKNDYATHDWDGNVIMFSKETASKHPGKS